MSKSDEYLAYVAECQRKADSSIEEADKRPLSLAQSWQVRTRERVKIEDMRRRLGEHHRTQPFLRDARPSY